MHCKQNGQRRIEYSIAIFCSSYPNCQNWAVFPISDLYMVKEQIKRARPDVLYVQHIAYFPPEFLFEVKQYTKLLVGQIASDHPPVHFYKPYDLVLTSLPNFLAFFKEHQIPAEYFKIAFEPTVLGKAKPQKLYDCTFVGGFGHHHRKGREHLEAVARALPLALFGPNLNGISTDSPLKDCYRGPAWGRDMYNILQSSKIGLNRHADFAGDYANNMRLYEVTGSGALLITDAKCNMSDLFEVGKEVVVYNNADELIDLVRYYLTHDQEREAIAKAGQKRTLQEHTYFHRMQELISIVDRYV